MINHKLIDNTMEVVRSWGKVALKYGVAELARRSVVSMPK